MQAIDESIDVTNENIKELNPNWPQIPDQLQRTLITWSSGSGEMNSLFNVTSQQPDIDKIYWYMLKIHLKQNINF